MNNGSRDVSSTDVQKLQQQLQDIKEQVEQLKRVATRADQPGEQLTDRLTDWDFIFSDDVSGVPGPSQEHDLPLRSRYLSDVR